MQIRGHRVRLPLDIVLVATANPEDYTNRGRIITPLKDRFGAQVRTHYPPDAATELRIAELEADLPGPDGDGSTDGSATPGRRWRCPTSWPRSWPSSASWPARAPISTSGPACRCA